MNNDYLFLENLYHLLEQGYSIQDTLLICKDISSHKAIASMLKNIDKGADLKQVIADKHLSKEFIEYYEFFSKKLILSDAIRNALDICKNINNTKKKLVSQLTYPLILLLFLLMFSLFSIFILFPKVNELFVSFSISYSIYFLILFNMIRIVPILIILVFTSVFLFFFSFLISLRNKDYMKIEKFLRMPYLKKYIQKYFTLKFSIYFNELLKDQIDTNMIIKLLNERMTGSDIKIVIYEIYSYISKGDLFENIIENLEYFDPLFITMYKMYLKSPKKICSMQNYIDISINQIEEKINRFIKYFIPAVYTFVAFFVIMTYLAIILPMMNIIGSI